MKKITIAFLMICLTGSLYAQSSQTKISAFQESYTAETNGKYDDAIRAITSLNLGDDYAANLRLGWFYYMKGEHPASEKHYRKAITAEPSSVEALLGLVYPVSAMEHWDDLVRTYETILKLDPQNVTANYRLGYIYYYRKDYPMAKKFLGPLVKRYPFDFDGLELLGWTEFRLGNMAVARKYFERALMNSPTNESAAEGLKAVNGE